MLPIHIMAKRYVSTNEELMDLENWKALITKVISLTKKLINLSVRPFKLKTASSHSRSMLQTLSFLKNKKCEA